MSAYPLGDGAQPLLDLHPLIDGEEVRYSSRIQEIIDIVEHEATFELGVWEDKDAAGAVLSRLKQHCSKVIAPLIL